MASPRQIRLDSLPSATGGIARLVAARLNAAKIPSQPLLAKAGITAAQIEDRTARIAVQGQIRLLEFAAKALGDNLLGFHLARDCELREIGLLYYVLTSSEQLSDALAKAERYGSIVNEGVSLHVRRGRQTGISFRYVNVPRRADRQHVDFWLTILVRLCRQLTNRRLVPSRIRVIDHGRRTPAELKSYFGCPIEFGAGLDDVAFAGETMRMPVVGADSYLHNLLIRYCDEALAHRRGHRDAPLRREVENAIVPLLPHGTASAHGIARRLGVSHRTLARRLADEGLSFSIILHDLKLDLAKRYLQEGLPISRIAWLLGYREVSAFTHAFKRWTGRSPKQMRQREKADVVDLASRRKRRRV